MRLRPGKRVNGRKWRIAVDIDGMLLVVLVTMAGVQGRDGGLRLLVLLRERLCTITCVWAVGGYAGGLVACAEKVLAFTVEVV